MLLYDEGNLLCLFMEEANVFAEIFDSEIKCNKM